MYRLIKMYINLQLKNEINKNIKNIHKIKYSNENKTKLIKLNC